MTPETVDDLIRRVEAAMGPDRELDALIYCWHYSKSAFADASERMAYLSWAAPDYTASIDAALALVERVLGPDWWGSVDFGDWRGQPVGARLTYKENAAKANGKAASPALAILAALLRATRSTEA